MGLEFSPNIRPKRSAISLSPPLRRDHVQPCVVELV
jgi:hypothetical protein